MGSGFVGTPAPARAPKPAIRAGALPQTLRVPLRVPLAGPTPISRKFLSGTLDLWPVLPVRLLRVLSGEPEEPDPQATFSPAVRYS